MRVAISGAHCCGKSTLIDAFLLRHEDYAHEPEPYEALQDLYAELFAAELTAEDFSRQLEYQVGRLHQYHAGDRVIFERSPADFLAYMLALSDLGRERADTELSEGSIEMVGDAVILLDVIVFIPAGGVTTDAEDPELRSAVDARLESILIDDDLGMFTTRRPMVVEAYGTTAQRLRTLESALQ